MRIAALYDIHGNLPALEAVLADVRAIGVDRVVVGGDVLPGPMPREALARLFDLDVPTQFLYGNGEIAVLDHLDGRTPTGLPPQYLPMIEWVGAQMTGDQSAAVRAWPKTLRVAIPGVGDALFCHATPRDENEIFSRLTPDDLLQPVFDTLDCALVVCGHTHMPFVRTIGRTRVVNAGSVGMPFGGDTAAQWLLIEGSDSTLGAPAIEPRRTPYDVNAAADTIRATRCPLADEFFVRNLINPPAEQQMLDAFTFASFGRRTD